MFKAPADLPNDIDALKAFVLAQQTELQTHALLIEALRLQIARLRKQKYGRSSEKIQREIEQLELALEGLEIASAANKDAPLDEGDKLDGRSVASRLQTPKRRHVGGPAFASQRRVSALSSIRETSARIAAALFG